MPRKLRKCKKQQNFNTGKSRCGFDPEKVKAIILTLAGYKLPENLTLEDIKKAIHADRPNRIYPIIGIVEFAQSGGEAESSARGYGPNKITGYSARTDTFTLESFDADLTANIVKAKSVDFDVYFVNENNVIIAEKDDEGVLRGVPMSGVAVGGQTFGSSGDTAYTSIDLLYKDVERFYQYIAAVEVDFDIVGALHGLTYVTLVKDGTNNKKYYLAEDRTDLDIGEYYGDQLAEKDCWQNVESVSYDGDGYIIELSSGGGTVPLLQKPSVLLEQGIEGIEQAA